MGAPRTLLMIQKRFAGKDGVIERHFRVSETFRGLCRDYLACASTLVWWENSDSDDAGLRASEFSDLLSELGREISRWLEEGEGPIASPSQPQARDTPPQGGSGDVDSSDQIPRRRKTGKGRRHPGP